MSSLRNVLVWIGCAGLAVSGLRADSSIVVTYEAPGVQNSSVLSSQVFTFDELESGSLTEYGWGEVGIFAGGTIADAGPFGGAGGTGKYLFSSDGSWTTLSLNSPISYFGFWWSAGNNGNTIDFYSGFELICSFDTTILGELPASYNGNPDMAGANSGEKYAFLNFFIRDGGTVNRIEAHGYNFESDNWTIREAAYGSDPQDGDVLPGSPALQINTTASGTEVISDPSLINMSVPEPSAFSLLAVGLGVVLRPRRRAV